MSSVWRRPSGLIDYSFSLVFSIRRVNLLVSRFGIVFVMVFRILLILLHNL